MKNARLYVIAATIVIFLGVFFWWLLGSYLDFQAPQLEDPRQLSVIGRQKWVDVRVTDSWSGLRRLEVSITQDGKATLLQTVQISPRGIHEKTLQLLIDPYTLKLRNGPAVFQVNAVDYGLLRNRLAASLPVTIDMNPPQISFISSTNYLNQGGTGVATFRTSKPVEAAGVWVDRTFVPAYPIVIGGQPAMIAYFAVPPDARNGVTSIRVAVRDQAGNEASLAFPCLIRMKKFRSDTMELSDSFLQRKMPDFQTMDPALRDKSLIDTFIAINTTMREENTKTIQAVNRRSVPRQLWQGTFLRMKNASPMAMFGDHRIYLYGGKPISESFHWGVDLASLAQAPVEAANSGIVAFTGPLGIYGNAVIIDHGYGLSSLYGHLSRITVQTSQTVKKGDVIGNTGMTGLAGGDHLHFGVMAGGRFVDPTEWWDPHWIKDNVLTKLALPEAAPTTAAATQPVPAATASASPAAVSVPPPPSR